MAELRAPGLRASWLNGWLAALGVTVLVDGARLRWSDDVVPVAMLEIATEGHVAAAVAAALPSPGQLDAMAIAHLTQNVSPETYPAAAQLARERRDFSIAASMTDLVRIEKDTLPNGPFNIGAPRGARLWDRLKRCRELVPETALVDTVRLSLDGRGARRVANGLGFDYTRITASGDPSEKMVDPVIECLAFYGLAFFPVRGNGRRGERGVCPRGWRGDRLSWAVWSAPLDRWAIDALLGLAFADEPRDWPRLRLGITQVYETVAFDYAKDDRTRGFASRRLV